MDTDSGRIRQAVTQAVSATLRQAGREVPNPLEDDTLLNEGLHLDSLDLAVVVVELERQLGVDPFRQAGTAIRTLGDLVAMYQRTQGISP